MKIRIAIPGYERILQLISTIRSNYSSDVEFAVVPPDAFTGNGGEKIRAVEQAGDVDIFVASGSAYACFEQYVERTALLGMTCHYIWSTKSYLDALDVAIKIVTKQQTQQGTPGWEFMFLENGFHVNVSDGVERGRTSWPQFPQITPVPPMFNSYAERWTTYRLGERLGEPYPGSRFDASKFDDLIKQQVPRWTTSIPMAQDAYNAYDGCILLAHSQGGLFALNAAPACPQNVKAIVLIESSFTLDVTQTDVSSLKNVSFLFVWSDFLGEAYRSERYTWIGDFAYTKTMRSLHQKILDLGGCSQWLHLPEMGIRGNTHAMMIEDNSRQIADMVCDWLKAQLARPARL